MRVLIVTQYFYPESFRVNDLALGLRDRGYQVTVLTGLPNYPEGRVYAGYGWRSKGETWEGIRIVRVPLVARGDSGGLRLAANFLSFAFFASLLGPLRCRGEFEAIFVFEPSPITVGLPAMVMKRLYGAPMLFWVQDLWPEVLSAAGSVKSKSVLWLVDRLVRRIYHSCDRVLVQSEGFADHVTARGVPAERVNYYPNWAEDFFRPVELPVDAPERAEMPEGFRILFAGNIGASQSFETILQAAELTRDEPRIQWVVLGDGRQREWVAQEAQTRGLAKTFHLLGRRPVETMPRYFATADALLCTLQRDRVMAMTIPSKLQSYLACGRPVLAALDGEGARVVEQSGAGYTAAAEDAAGLAEHARRMFACSEAERKRMGWNGREFFQRHFDRTLLLDRLEGLFAETTGRIPFRAGQREDQSREAGQCAA